MTQMLEPTHNRQKWNESRQFAKRHIIDTDQTNSLYMFTGMYCRQYDN